MTATLWIINTFDNVLIISLVIYSILEFDSAFINYNVIMITNNVIHVVGSICEIGATILNRLLFKILQIYNIIINQIDIISDRYN